MARLAIIGDVHGAWDATDSEYFNESDYQCILFVGDLAPLAGGQNVARRIAEVRRPALLIPGNHDGCTPLQLLAEIRHRPRAAARLSRGQEERLRKLDAALGSVTLTGYSLHRCGELDIIAARPHAMGGDRLYFRDYLYRRFGIRTMAESTRRLKQLVDQAGDEILFLGHNGPGGLGKTPDSVWGCDFDPARGDFGEPDLRDAVEYARHGGRRVHAVVAGHMHHRIPGGWRRWWHRKNGTWFLNAARVPRIESRDGGRQRHHLRLETDTRGACVSEVWVRDDGTETLLPPS